MRPLRIVSATRRFDAPSRAVVGVLPFVLILIALLAALLVCPLSADDTAAQDDELTASGEWPPADSEWVEDEESGRKYTIVQVKKRDGRYRWIDDTHIRVTYGQILEVVEHDDEYFWVRVWEAKPWQRRKEPTPEELAAAEKAREAAAAAVAATYATDWETVDRLRLESIAQGLPSSGQWRNNFDIVDIDGDGRLDIVHGPARKSRNQPNLFLQKDDGWARWDQARFTGRPLDYGGVSAGDFDGDGRQDLVFGVHLRGLMAFAQRDDGAFEPWDEGIEWDHPGQGGDASSFSSRRVETVDWDLDGDIDIVTLGEGPKGRSASPNSPGAMIGSSRGLVLYENVGDGTWKWNRLDSGIEFGDHFELADLDGDGKLDVAVAGRHGGLKDILRFQNDDGTLETSGIASLRDGLFTSSIAVDDLDRDGRADVIVGYRAMEAEVWRSGVDIFYGGAEESWTRVTLAAVEGRSDFTALDTGDLDGDGFVDVVALTGEGMVRIFLGSEGRSFREEVVAEGPPRQEGCSGHAVRIVDLDADPGPEIVASFAGEVVGMVGIPGLSKPGCRGEGSLRAWKVVKATD